MSAANQPTSQPQVDYSLAREIASMRVLLARIESDIASEENATQLVAPLTRLVESIARTIKAHNAISGGPVDRLDELVSIALRSHQPGPVRPVAD